MANYKVIEYRDDVPTGKVFVGGSSSLRVAIGMAKNRVATGWNGSIQIWLPHMSANGLYTKWPKASYFEHSTQFTVVHNFHRRLVIESR